MGQAIRVLALVQQPSQQAGTRHRVEQYIPLLRSHGIELQISPFYDTAAYRVLYAPGHTLAKALAVFKGIARRLRDLLHARRYDVVLVVRESAPIGPPAFERALRATGGRYVFDFDDAIFMQPPYSANRRWGWLRRPSRVAAAARGACAVVVGNEYLAETARNWNACVAVIPTPVDTDRHRPRPRSHTAGPVVIGWLGQATTAPYLHLLDDALAELARRHVFVFRVVGGRYENDRVRVEEREFEVDREAADVQSFDIGVLPQPDDPWTRGKGAYKAKVYMATGVPVVASRGGVNSDVVVDNETGFCVSTTAEWVDALERLIKDPTLRERLGTAGRRHAEERHSVRVEGPRLARVLLGAVAQGRQ